MYALQYLVINKNFYLLNKGNKQILQANARAMVIMVTPLFVSEKADTIIGAIVKKVSGMKPDETTLRKVLEYNAPENTLPDEAIEALENKLENMLNSITEKTTMNDVTSEIGRFGINLN